MPALQLGLIARPRRRRPDEPALALHTRLPLPRLLGWAAVEIAAAAAAFAVTAPLVRLPQTLLNATDLAALLIFLGAR